VADLIKHELGIETELVEGDRGEFTVWVGSRMVATKENGAFPTDAGVISALKRELAA